MIASSTTDELVRRAKQVRDNQSVWHQHWDDLARVMVPRLLGFSEAVIGGASRVDEIFDGTPMLAARGLAHAIAAMCRPDGEKWALVKAEEDDLNEDDEARAWLENSTDRLHNQFNSPRTRFRDVTGAADLGLVVFGTSPFFIGETKGLNGLQFQSIYLKDAGIDWDEDADAYAFYRFRRYTARQAEARFGFENLGQRCIDLLKSNKLDERVSFIHAVVPRTDRMLKGGVLARNMPFASLWIEEESKHICSESGYHEFPFAIPRMETAPNEEYGRSAGMVALPDSNTLQAMGETLLTAGQKAAEPPLMAPNDGTFNEANTYPGGISYYDVSVAAKLGRNPIFPLETGGNIPLTREMQNDVREQVYAAFFRNILNLPVDSPQMTATEIIERKQEFLREVGPMFGRMEANYTAPTVERSFMVMLRGGGFAPIPQILAGRNIKFEYESPVKRIRKQIEASAAAMWMREALTIAPLRPEIMDQVNVDEYIRFQHDAAKIPEKLLHTDDEIAMIREARAKQAQDAMLAQNLGAAAQIGKTGAEAMKAAGMTQAAA